jgi:hypothetical protein
VSGQRRRLKSVLLDESVGGRRFTIRNSQFLEELMRFVNIYLVGYFLLVMGALAALWYGGVLRQISPIWIIIGLVVAFGLGIMLSVSAGKPEITRES